MEKTKDTLSVITAPSLRRLVEMVNTHNIGAVRDKTLNPILKEDIVSITKENDTYLLLYFE